jgi:retron-type reverse transcriptase
LTKNRLIQDLREPKKYLKAVLTKKLINYIRKGKITVAHSFKYQDIGKFIESIEFSDGAIANILNGKQASKWGGMSPVSMENIALFFPA